MFHNISEKWYLSSQLEAIQYYLQRHSDEDPNTVVLRWINQYAEGFRTLWNRQIFRG